MRSALLVHGLFRTPCSLFPLTAVVRRSGVRPHFFAYSSTLESLDRILARLKRALCEYRPDFLIAHSLGGILLRLALGEHPPCAVRHFVMLGTPNRSPQLARYFWGWKPFRLAAGSCGRFLATQSEYERLPPLPCPTSVFAGTAGPTGRLSWFGAEPNDGFVSVEEARVADGPDPILVHAWHTWMMAHPEVRRRLAAIMKVG